MPLNEQEELRLAYLMNRAGLEPERPSVPQRIGRSLANWPSELAAAAGSLTGTEGPEAPYTLPAPQGGWEVAADVGTGIGKAVAELAVPASVGTRLARAAGVAERFAPIVGDVLAGAYMGSKSGHEAEMAAEFGLGGATRFLPKPVSIAANVAIPVAGQLARGESPTSTESMIGTGAQALFSAFQRRVPWSRAEAQPSTVIIPDEIIPPGQQAAQPQAALPWRGQFPEGGYPALPERGQLLLEGPMAYGHGATDTRFRRVGEPFAPQGDPIAMQDRARLPWRAEDEIALAQQIDEIFGLKPVATTGELQQPGLVRRSTLGREQLPTTPAPATAPAPAAATTAEVPVVESRVESASPEPAPAVESGQADNRFVRFPVPDVNADSHWRLKRYASAGIAGNKVYNETGSGVMADREFDRAWTEFIPPQPAQAPAPVRREAGTTYEQTQPQEAQSLPGVPEASGAMQLPEAAPVAGKPLPKPKGKRSKGGFVASPAVLAQAASTGAGALGGAATGDTPEERWRNAALGAAIGFGAPMLAARLGNVLGRSKPAGDTPDMPLSKPERAVKDAIQRQRDIPATEAPTRTASFLKRATAAAATPGESVALAKEKGHGLAELLRDVVSRNIPALRDAGSLLQNPPKPLHDLLVKWYEQPLHPTMRTLQEQQIEGIIGAKAVKALREIRGAKVQAQETIRAAQPDAIKSGNWKIDEYQTRAYDAWLRPKGWAPTKPQIDAMVKKMRTWDEFKGADDWFIRKALDDYAKDVREKGIAGADYSSDGSRRIDQSLFIRRKELPQEVRDFLGEITNPVERELATLNKLTGSVAQSKTITELFNMTDARGNRLTMTDRELQDAVRAAEAAGDTARAAELKRYEKIADSEGLGMIKGHYAHPDVVQAATAMTKLEQNSLLKTLGRFIRGAATVGNVSTHGKQWMQIIPQAMVLRVLPGDPVFASAIKAISQKRDVWRKMLRLGITDSGAEADLTESVHDFAAMWAGPKGVAEHAGYGAKRLWKRVGGWYRTPDAIVRIAGYLKNEPRFLAEGKAKGLTGDALVKYAEDATTKFVNRYSTNYRLNPEWVKTARDIPGFNMFINYTAAISRVLKNLGEDVMTGDTKTKAWAVANLAQLFALPLLAAKAGRDALNEEDQKRWDASEKMAPAWQRGQIAVPLGRNKAGGIDQITLNSISPAGDFVSMAKSLASGDMEALLKNNPIAGVTKSPLLNLASSIQAGKNQFTGQPVETAGEIASEASAMFVPPWTHPRGYMTRKLAESFEPNAEGGRGTVNERTGRMQTPGRGVASFVGVPISSRSPEALARNARAEYEREVRDAKTAFRRVVQGNAGPDKVEKEKAKFLKKREEAKAEYQRKMAPWQKAK